MLDPPTAPTHHEPLVILASGSPRRRALLDLLGIPHLVRPADIDETVQPGEEPAAYCRRAARDKALHVAGSDAALPVLAADTVVELDGESLGKPDSPGHAAEMLWRLSGRAHEVHTAVALASGERVDVLLDTAIVRFRDLDSELVDWYVASSEPMDKAGGYAVQGRGGVLVESITGSPHTVVGLPIHRLDDLWSGLGLDFRRLLALSRR
jgi:septum formation protein